MPIGVTDATAKDQHPQLLAAELRRRELIQQNGEKSSTSQFLGALTPS